MTLTDFISEIILFHLHCYDHSRDERDAKIVTRKIAQRLTGRTDPLPSYHAFYGISLNQKDNGDFCLTTDYILNLSYNKNLCSSMSDVMDAIRYWEVNGDKTPQPSFRDVAT